MRGEIIVALMIAMGLVAGCQPPKEDSSDKQSRPLTLRIAIDSEEEHLGHNINESGGHSVWCDGIRARIVPSNEEFMIYSTNSPFKNSAYRFEKGHRYDVRFSGELGTGIMAYNGKCVSLDQVSEVIELSPEKRDDR